MENLIEGIQRECNRARELRAEYEEIPFGMFGVALIDKAILDAERSVATGDTVAMIKAYKELEGLEWLTNTNLIKLYFQFRKD